MFNRSLPIPAMIIDCCACLLASLGLLAAPLAWAQTTPEVSTVLAMSGSRTTDGVILGTDGSLYGASLTTTNNDRRALFPVSRGRIFRPDAAPVRHHGWPLARRRAVACQRRAALRHHAIRNGGVRQGGGTIFRVALDGTGFTVLHQLRRVDPNNVIQPDQYRRCEPDRCADRRQRRIPVWRHPIWRDERYRHDLQDRQGR